MKIILSFTHPHVVPNSSQDKQNPSIANYYMMFNDVQYQAKNNRQLAALIDET